MDKPYTELTLNIGSQVVIDAYTTSGLELEYIISDENVASLYDAGGKKVLDCLSEGTITIKVLQPGDTNYYPAIRVIKELTVTAPSAIDGAESDAVSVIAANGVIVVKDAPMGCVVNVYTPAGVIAASQAVTEGVTRIEGLTPGLYIVTIAGKSYKVVL